MSQPNHVHTGFEGRCPTGKRAHPTRAEAKKHARRLQQKGQHVRPYECDQCPFWHVGHLRQEIMFGRRVAGEVFGPRRAS